MNPYCRYPCHIATLLCSAMRSMFAALTIYAALLFTVAIAATVAPAPAPCQVPRNCGQHNNSVVCGHKFTGCEFVCGKGSDPYNVGCCHANIKTDDTVHATRAWISSANLLLRCCRRYALLPTIATLISLLGMTARTASVSTGRAAAPMASLAPAARHQCAQRGKTARTMATAASPPKVSPAHVMQDMRAIIAKRCRRGPHSRTRPPVV